MVEDEKIKKLEEYKQDKPVQLNLFEFLLPQEQKYSNTIELYDFIPKYHWGKAPRENGKYLPTLKRTFECRGAKYNVKIKPASIEDKDGVERYYYPGKREELVEDALRKLVSEGQGLFLDEQAGVTFTLYRLQQELKRVGHSYSVSEIKDALYICSQTHLELTSESGSAVLKSNMFETLGLQTREDWQGVGQKTRAFVRFNSLVTASIKSQTFRQLDYDKAMAFNSTIARQLHKRLSHHYIQASLNNPYTIFLSTIIRDFGLTAYKKLANNLRDVKTALDELKEKEVILDYKIERTIDATQRNRLLDAKLTLTPHPRFSSEVIKANERRKRTKLLAFNSQKP